MSAAARGVAAVGYNGQKLMFRCKAKGDPADELCKGAQWRVWQTG